MNDNQIKRQISKQVEGYLNQTRFTCAERSCRFNGIHLFGQSKSFDCTLKSIVVGIKDNNGGHWCDRYEEGKPWFCEGDSNEA